LFAIDKDSNALDDSGPTQEHGVKVVDMSQKRYALLVQDLKVLVLAPPIFRYVTPLWAIPTAQTHLIVELNKELFHSVSNRESHVLSFQSLCNKVEI
jgi:hypothetical protein